MSMPVKDRITVRPFGSVPALPGLPEIRRPDTSVSNDSSRSSVGDEVGLAEGCMITGVVKYTLVLAQLVNAVQDPEQQNLGDIEDAIDEMGIIPFEYFTLNHLCNFAFLDPSMHTAFDLYSFVAIVPSSSTLDELIQMVKSDNDLRQSKMDTRGVLRPRVLDVNVHLIDVLVSGLLIVMDKLEVPSFTNPQFELIVLHPEHFLPFGSPLTVYNPVTRTYKNYVVATDRCLRESVNPTSPLFPPFSPPVVDCLFHLRPNVFLVALNAEIKCRRYFQTVTTPSSTPLPEHVHSLMHRTIELVELLYWRPVPTKGSKGETIYSRSLATERKNQIPSSPSAPSRRRRRFRWPADMDLEARIAYGSALMSGHDRDYGPEFFGDAVELESSAYSNKANVESWRESTVYES